MMGSLITEIFFYTLSFSAFYLAIGENGYALFAKIFPAILFMLIGMIYSNTADLRDIQKKMLKNKTKID